MYRHWNAWHDFEYTPPVHVAPIGADGRAERGNVDLMKGHEGRLPGAALRRLRAVHLVARMGSTSPYTAKDVERLGRVDRQRRLPGLASTRPPSRDATSPPGQHGYDNDPAFSPDGKHPGLPLDGARGLRVRPQPHHGVRSTWPAARSRDVTAGLDQTAHGATLAPTRQRLCLHVGVAGDQPAVPHPLRGRRPHAS